MDKKQRKREKSRVEERKREKSREKERKREKEVEGQSLSISIQFS